MRHLKKNKKFGRVRRQRNALINGLIQSLVEREKIITTQAKAKNLRPMMEKIITKGKKNNLSTMRYLLAFLKNSSAKKVVDVLSPRYKNRKGGYTRITKLPNRKSDGSPISMIEFVK